MEIPEPAKELVQLAIPSWNPDNFSDLLELLTLQYGEANLLELKIELGIKD